MLQKLPLLPRRGPMRGVVLIVTFLMLKLIFDCYYLFNLQPTQASQPTRMDQTCVVPAAGPPPVQALFVFIASGNSQYRNENIHRNLQVFNQTHEVTVDCIIFSYAKYKNQPLWLREMHDTKNSRCTVITVYALGFVGFLKFLNPYLLKKSGYDYLTLVMDDVAFLPPNGNFQIQSFFDQVIKKNLAVASPGMINSYHYPLQPAAVRKGQMGRVVTMVEIQFTTYRMDAWSCIYELVDTEYPSGHGMDIWFQDYCVTSGKIKDGTQAIIDTMFVTHNPLNLPSTNRPGVDLSVVMRQQELDWQRYRDVTLIQTWPWVSTKGKLWEE